MVIGYTGLILYLYTKFPDPFYKEGSDLRLTVAQFFG